LGLLSDCAPQGPLDVGDYHERMIAEFLACRVGPVKAEQPRRAPFQPRAWSRAGR
jgi:hypothetical protein